MKTRREKPIDEALADVVAELKEIGDEAVRQASTWGRSKAKRRRRLLPVNVVDLDGYRKTR